MQFVSKLAQKNKEKLSKDRSVKYLLHKILTQPDLARPTKNVHASAVTGESGKEFCPREYAIRDLLVLPAEHEYLSTSEAVTYQIGRDLQANVSIWLGKYAVGGWRCVVCGTAHVWQLCPSKCQQKNCDSINFVYEETRFTSLVSGISGGIDLCVLFDKHELIRIVEIKTIDKDKFKELQAPFGTHRVRTSLYLRLIEESDHPARDRIDTKMASILYVSKGGYGTADPDMAAWGLKEKFSPFKEFIVERNDESNQIYTDKARKLLEFRKNAKGMPIKICPTSFCKRAYACSVLKQCWSDAYPEGRMLEKFK